jgi:hypothetical protein
VGESVAIEDTLQSRVFFKHLFENREPQVRRLKNDKMEITNPVDALEHANAEVEAAHIHCISSFTFPGSHLSRGLRSARHSRSGGCRSVNRGVDLVIEELILKDSSVKGLNDWRWRRRTDNNFIVIICIMELMHDFNNDANEIALTGRQSSQQIKAACDES